MTLKDLQQVSLEILKDIHTFCVAHDIKYSIAYGTLIGAIRHKGFIPWDDDIDVLMPREDYERFFQLYQSERFTPYYPTPQNSYLAFGHICDNQRTITKTTLPMQPIRLGDKGVWVDIFPLDGVATNEADFKKEMQQYIDLVHEEHEYRGAQLPLSCHLPWSEIKRVIRRRIHTCHFHMEEMLAKRMQLMLRHPFAEAEYVGNLSFTGYAMKERYPKACFDEYVLLPFEDAEFYACKGYDTVLRAIYGDYMQLPPIEKRVPKMDYIKFYWK